jgi:hypothetical protein
MNKETKVLYMMYTLQFGPTDNLVVAENLTYMEL